jgi:ribonucleotide reductase alpha subunit
MLEITGFQMRIASHTMMESQMDVPILASVFVMPVCALTIPGMSVAITVVAIAVATGKTGYIP